MINHVRTLLLNRSTSERESVDFPGEFYVPDLFYRRQLSGPAAVVWKVLFGANPDRFALNYRLQEATQILKGSELRNDIFLHDSRITYGDYIEPRFLLDSYGYTIEQEAPDLDVFVTGDFAQDAAGRCRQRWKIHAISPTSLDVSRLSPPPTSVPVSLTFSGNLSQRFRLPGAGLLVQMRQPSPGKSIWIEATTKPTAAMGELMLAVDSALQAPGGMELFAASLANPSVGDKWLRVYQSEVAVNRMAAVLLALAETIGASPISDG